MDLDIIFYGDRTVRKTDPQLIVPHARFAERPFVVAPVVDLLGGRDGVSTVGESAVTCGGGARKGSEQTLRQALKSASDTEDPTHWSNHKSVPGGILR